MYTVLLNCVINLWNHSGEDSSLSLNFIVTSFGPEVTFSVFQVKLLPITDYYQSNHSALKYRGNPVKCLVQ